MPPTNDERYQQLKTAIADIGWIRRGSVAKRYMPCGKPGCRCQADPPTLHGPYYQWTRNAKGGNSTTLRLSAEQAQLMQSWIDNGRKLNNLIAQMEQIALEHTNQLLEQAPQPPGKARRAAKQAANTPPSGR